MTRRFPPAILALAALAAVAACTPGRPPPPPAAAAVTPAGNATVVSIRPVPGQGNGTDVRGSILLAVGQPGRPEAAGNAVEFVLRADDGQTLSVVQSNDAGLHPGERVALSPGPQARLARVGQ